MYTTQTQHHPAFHLFTCILMALALSGCSFLQGASTWKQGGFSMVPNIQDGQILSVTKVELSELQRGDLIILEHGKDTLLKRLIGLPGETVEIHDGKTFINGKVLEEPYKPTPPAYQQALLQLGANQYYVLGDNRNNSLDSHLFGPILGEQIKGRATP